MDLLLQCADALRTSNLSVAADTATRTLHIGNVRLHARVEPRGLQPSAVAAVRMARNEVLLLPYANPLLAAELRAAGVPFIDTAGNAWVVQPPLLIAIDGRRPAQRSPRGRPSLLAGGLQLIFALLQDPGAARLPYRELARRGGVALGTVANTIAWLRDHGHLVAGDDGLHIVDRARLLERWELGYLEVLRDTLVLGRARIAGGAPVEALLAREDGDALIGGELAAAQLLGTFVAASASVHVHVPVQATLTALRLVPDPSGPVTLLRRFGAVDAGERRGVARLAAPLLVRAELLASGDARVRAAAEGMPT